MAIIFQPYTLILLATVFISAALMIVVVINRPTSGAYAFALMMGALCMWAFTIIFEVIFDDPPTKNFAGNFKYLFIVTIPVAWFAFSLRYANRARYRGRKGLTLLAVIPVVTLLMVATNDLHHWMFKSITWVPVKGLIMPSRVYGPWFWVHTTYSYALIFLGFLILAKSIIDSRQLFRRQALILLIGALAPWLCNVFFLLGTHPLPYLDLTPFAFSISGVAIAWGITRYRLLDIIPIAREIVIQSMDDGLIVLDNRHRILDANLAATALLGRPQQDLIGCEISQVIDWWPRLSAGGHPNNASAPTVVEVGHPVRSRYLHISKSTIVNHGQSTGQLVILRDVTEMRTTQDALRQSEGRFKSLSENAPVMIMSVDVSGTLTYVNPVWKAILGHEREEIVGQPLKRFLAELSQAACADAMTRLLRGEEVVAERNIQFIDKQGAARVFDITASVNSDEEGRITGIVCLGKDVTEERRLQEQLFQSQKMEAIGTLAGGIAHDFNNLLMGMQANVSLLRLDVDHEPQITDKLMRIEEQIQSGASLTRQLLGYARKGKYVLATANAHQLIDETLQVIQRTNKSIAISRQLEADPPFMEADKGQIEMVLLNLFVNAMDAMPNGGQLMVTTRTVDWGEPDLRWRDLKPGRYIEIQVSDNGVGMDQKTMARIFEPFFTTKEIGRGTGLGLASVYGVVKNHHGDIQVHSTLGQGSTFYLIFPALTVVKPPKSAPAVQIITFPRGQKVLLVDDEQPVLQYVGEMIESLGFNVLRAADGQTALRLFKQHCQTIDLVVLDLIMPEMDGRELFDLLQAVQPHIKVLFISGYAAGSQPIESANPVPYLLLTKPFTREELAEAIGKALTPGDAQTGGHECTEENS
ncbi:MAG: PAS domain S-box protein [Desulfobacteraceae bacterium]|nr:PAS domain S-box protein [Desulfobacteraceae bacterium]